MRHHWYLIPPYNWFRRIHGKTHARVYVCVVYTSNFCPDEKRSTATFGDTRDGYGCDNFSSYVINSTLRVFPPWWHLSGARESQRKTRSVNFVNLSREHGYQSIRSPFFLPLYHDPRSFPRYICSGIQLISHYGGEQFFTRKFSRTEWSQGKIKVESSRRRRTNETLSS